jgi:hypothetical protein
LWAVVLVIASILAGKQQDGEVGPAITRSLGVWALVLAGITVSAHVPHRHKTPADGDFSLGVHPDINQQDQHAFSSSEEGSSDEHEDKDKDRPIKHGVPAQGVVLLTATLMYLFFLGLWVLMMRLDRAREDRL